MFKDFKIPEFVDTAHAVAKRCRLRRKEYGYTQKKLADLAGISLSTVKRFEKSGEILFGSLIKIAVVLNAEGEVDSLFARKHYRSLKEIIDEQH